jgi:hypothetical protein
MRKPSAELLHEDGSHFRWITRREANQMIELKNARRIIRRKSSRLIVRLIAHPAPSESHASNTGITFREMLANVGIGEPGEISAARRKIRNYK